ncbi:helix-turn-helix domain-containing protein [Lacticaseibacillus sp. GG6-2]
MFVESLIHEPTAPLLFNLYGCDWQQEEVDHTATGYPDFVWLQTRDGSGEVQFADKRIQLNQDQAILIAPKLPFSYRPLSGSWHTAFLTYNGTLAGELSAGLGLKTYLLFPKLSQQLTTFIPDHMKIFVDDTPQARIQQSTAIYQFLLLLRQQNNDSVSFYNHSLIEPILNYIDAHFSEPITNDTLRQLTGYSAPYQNKIFREFYGMTPLQYLTRYRIKQAKAMLLEHSNRRVQDVASDAGFTDMSHFISVFKQDTGYTPLRFRNCHQFGRSSADPKQADA